MASISINGINYQGNNIKVNNGKIIVDGQTISINDREINISIEGNINELKVDTCEKIFVNGEVSNLSTMSGDVEVTGDVRGSVQTMSGDVDCGNIMGNIKTMSGDIKHKKND